MATQKRTVPVHYMRPNHRETSPKNVLFFDTETKDIQFGTEHMLSMRVWVAVNIRRKLPSTHKSHETWAEGNFSHQLVDFIEKSIRAKETLWICTHNLFFDIKVSCCLEELIKRGWEVTKHALHSDSPWAMLKKGNYHIKFFNSQSFLPDSIRQIGKIIGLPKLKMPTDMDDLKNMREYCQRDTEILKQAILQCMNWWDREEAGNWSMTSPATGFNSFRHRFMKREIVIDPNQEARDFERQSIYGGMRYCWHKGEIVAGSFFDLDFEHAFLTVMQTKKLPFKRSEHFTSLPLDHLYLKVSSVNIIANVKIKTDKPRYPLRTKDGTVYPVGEFWTTLPDPLIKRAIKHGHLLKVGEGYAYRMESYMKHWANWAETTLEDTTGSVPPIVKVMVKQWTRTVAGRWAGRTSIMAEEYDDPRPGIVVEEGRSHKHNCPIRMIRINHKMQVWHQNQDMDDAFPAVLSFIQGHVQCHLADLLDQLQDAPLQCNTDGVLIDVNRLAQHICNTEILESGNREMIQQQIYQEIDRLETVTAPMKIGIKAKVDRVNIRGAQHVEVGSELRLAGVPKQAEPTGKDTFRATLWPKASTQWQAQNEGVYILKDTKFDLSKVPVPGFFHPDGTVLPFIIIITDDDRNIFRPPHIGDVYTHGLMEFDRQHPIAKKILRQGVYSCDTS